MASSPYDEGFFASQRSGSLRSAQVVVPLVVNLFKPRSIVDVGCGIGTWASVALDAGVGTVVGLDGDYVNQDALLIPKSHFIGCDLNAVGGDTKVGRFDVAMCLEVAEHLVADRSQGFIDFLTGLAPIVVFGAALPAQGGTHHINERWPSAWVEMFSLRAFQLVDILRPRIWNDSRVAYWYRQNTVVFVRADHQVQIDVGREQVGPDVVHPELYARKSELLRSALRRVGELERLLAQQA